jgi:hypothetical protein
MALQAYEQRPFIFNEEVTFALLSEQLVRDLCYGQQNSGEIVCRNSQLCTYHFHLRQIHLIKLAHELNTTPTVISLATFTLLIHRYMYRSESVNIIANGHRLTIPVRNCKLTTIIMSIQIDEDATKSEFISTTSSADQSSKFVSQSPLILTIMTKKNCGMNFMFDCQLAYSDTYMDDKAARDMCEAYQRLIEYLSNLKTTFDLTYNELISIRLVSSNKSIDGPSELLTTTTSNSSIIYTYFQRMANHCFDQICLRQSKVRSLTYGKCLILVDHLSSILQCQLGVMKGSIVGLWMSSSVEYIIAILATLKLGAIFVPLDAEHPGKRLEFIEEQSHVDVILTTNKTFSSTKMDPAFSACKIQIDVTDCGDLKIDNSVSRMSLNFFE